MQLNTLKTRLSVMRYFKWPYLLLILLLFSSTHLFSQTPEWQWLKRAGGVSSWIPSQPGSPDDEITNIEVDKYGNVYVSGRIFSAINASVDTAKIKKMRGNRDGLIAKFSCDGVLIWYKIIGGPNNDRINDIAVDKFGNVYLTGGISSGINSTDSAYIGDNGYKFLSSQSFLTKLDSNGQEMWTHIGYSTNTNPTILTASVGYSVGISEDNSIYLYGTSESVGAEFYPGIELNETHFIAKYNDDGQVLWAKKIIPFPSSILIQQMDVNDKGSCFLVGTLRDTMTIGGTQFNPMNVNGESIVLEYDSSGDYVWGHISQAPVGCNGHRIAIDKKSSNQGDFYIVGNAVAGTKFGNLTIPSTNAAGIGYIVKYENRVPVWERHINSNASTGIQGVSVDQNQNVYVTEKRIGNLSIGGMKVGGKSGDPFVAKFSSSGDTIYTKVIATSTSGRPIAIANGFNGNFYVGGSFNQQIKILGDSVYNIGGNSDMFIAKYGIENCSDTTTIDTTTGIVENRPYGNQLNIYPNPNNGSFNIKLDELSNGDIKVYNTLGSLVYQENIKGRDLIQIDLPNSLVGGVYLVQFFTDSMRQSQRIVLRKE